MYERIAKRVGLPVEQVRAGMYALEHKARGILRPLGLYRHRMEARLESAVYSLMQKQKNYVLRHAEQLPAFREKGIRYVDSKALQNDLNDMMQNLPHTKDIVKNLYSNGALVLLKSGSRVVKELGLAKLGIEWSLTNKGAVQWLSRLTNLHLSDRDGSITHTTKLGIIDVIKQGAEQGLSYTELSKRINELDSTLFSRSRAELIATNTIGEAYEQGNRLPVQEASELGAVVEKLWQTVEDLKVTDECMENMNEGWIPLNQPHSSGDMNPLRADNPRCRCTELYRILDKTGS